ncbi:MAG: methylmalonyl-CoA mutase family protein, partial [Alphaproteobacteria bacterium]
NQFETEMRRIMAEIDASGGIVKAVAEGRAQADVSKQAYEHHRKLESGEFRKVGVNCYREDEEENAEVAFHPFKEEDHRLQIESLARIRAERDDGNVESTLAALEKAARDGENVMPAIMAAVKAYATVGEMSDVMVGIFGRFREPNRF